MADQRGMFTYASSMDVLGSETQRVVARSLYVPKHRYGFLLNQWDQLCNMVINQRKIKLTMNIQDGYVVLVTSPDNRSMSDLWKCFYFIRAVILGFKIIEANAILYSDDVGVKSIDMSNVSIKHKGHKWTLSCERNMKLYGRSRKTSIVMEGNLIHILGLKWSIQNAITSLPPLGLGCCVN